MKKKQITKKVVNKPFKATSSQISEKAIQIEVVPGLVTSLFILTDRGRLVRLIGDKWGEVKIPDFSQFDILQN